MIIVIVLAFFIGGGWLIGKLVANVLFPKSEDYSEQKQFRTIINNYK